ncbi:MAG: MFS transporter [Chloroflexota bacterium]
MSARPGPRLFYGWYVIGALFFMSLMGVGGRQGFGLFFPIWQERFDVSISALSAIAAAGWVVNGLSQPAAGALTDRFGGRRVMSGSMAVLGVGAVGVGLAPNPWVLGVLYIGVISTAMAGVMYASATSVASRWFRRRRGTAMSVLAAGGSVGGMVLVPLMAFLLERAGLEAAWLVIGAAMGLVGAPVLALVVRDDPAQLGLSPDGEGGPAAVGSRAPQAEGPLAVERWQAAYRTAPMWQLSLAYVVCGVTTATIAVHFIPYAASVGVSTSTAALAFGLLAFINLLGVLGTGALGDRLLRRDLLGLIYAVRGVAFALVLVLPAGVGLWVFAVVAGSSWLATVPQTSALSAEIYGVRVAGAVAGMMNMAHQLGGAAAVLLAGLVFDLIGSYAPTFAAGAILLVIAAALSFGVRERATSSRFAATQMVPGEA